MTTLRTLDVTDSADDNEGLKRIYKMEVRHNRIVVIKGLAKSFGLDKIFGGRNRRHGRLVNTKPCLGEGPI